MMSYRWIRAARHALPMSARKSPWTAKHTCFTRALECASQRHYQHTQPRIALRQTWRFPRAAPDGVLLSQGGNDGGYSLCSERQLCYAYNYVGRNLYYVESDTAVSDGRHTLCFEFEVTGKADVAHGKGAPGKGQLYIDGKLVGQGEIPLTNPLSIGLLSTINCGADVGAPVTPKYKAPFPFTGKIYKVTVDVSGELIKDEEAELRAPGAAIEEVSSDRVEGN